MENTQMEKEQDSNFKWKGFFLLQPDSSHQETWVSSLLEVEFMGHEHPEPISLLKYNHAKDTLYPPINLNYNAIFWLFNVMLKFEEYPCWGHLDLHLLSQYRANSYNWPECKGDHRDVTPAHSLASVGMVMESQVPRTPSTDLACVTQNPHHC